VREAAAEVVARRITGEAVKNLGFTSQAAKRSGVKDAGSIACKWSAVGVRRLGIDAPGKGTVPIDGNSGMQEGIRLVICGHGRCAITLHVWLYRSEGRCGS
jgi:hypothetical protein